MHPSPRCADRRVRRIRLVWPLFCLLLAACSPGTPPADPSVPAAFPAPVGFETIPGIPAGTPLPPADLKSGDHAITRNSIDVNLSGIHQASPPTTALRSRRLRAGGTTLSVLTFDGRAHHLAVVDNAGGPGTGATTAKAAAQSKNAPAAINAGFFTPEGNPLGLVIEDGTKLGSLNTSSLGAGIYACRPGSASLIRRAAWSRSSSPRHLLQSGPFLVENNTAVRGLSDSRPRPRSFLLWDGQHGWAIGHAGSTTLADLATTLAAQPVPGFTIKSALNLDGGTSADLWIAPSVTGGPVSTRSFWNKPVRNYLVLQPNRP